MQPGGAIYLFLKIIRLSFQDFANIFPFVNNATYFQHFIHVVYNEFMPLQSLLKYTFSSSLNIDEFQESRIINQINAVQLWSLFISNLLIY